MPLNCAQVCPIINIQWGLSTVHNPLRWRDINQERNRSHQYGNADLIRMWFFVFVVGIGVLDLAVFSSKTPKLKRKILLKFSKSKYDYTAMLSYRYSPSDCPGQEDRRCRKFGEKIESEVWCWHQVTNIVMNLINISIFSTKYHNISSYFSFLGNPTDVGCSFQIPR